MLDITDFHIWFLLLNAIIESRNTKSATLNKSIKYSYFITFRDILCLLKSYMKLSLEISIFRQCSFTNLSHHHGRLIFPLIQSLRNNLLNTLIKRWLWPVKTLGLIFPAHLLKQTENWMCSRMDSSFHSSFFCLLYSSVPKLPCNLLPFPMKT